MTLATSRLLHRRRPAPIGGDGARAGFGLIEAIVALAIAGLVLAAVTEIAGRTLRSWDRGFGTVAAIERTDVAIGRIATDLGTLLPIPLATADDPNILFAGDARGFSFNALTPLDRAIDGIAIVEIAVEGTADGAVLVRRLRRGRDMSLRDGDRVVLISGRLDLAFAYRDQAGKRVETWSRLGEVPRGVIVTLRGGRQGGGLPVEVMLPIPVAISVSCLLDSADGDGQATNNPGEETPAPADAAAARPKIDGDQPPTDAGDRRKRCATGPTVASAAAQAPAPAPDDRTPRTGGGK